MDSRNQARAVISGSLRFAGERDAWISRRDLRGCARSVERDLCSPKWETLGKGWNGEINNNNHFLGRHLVARVDRPLGILPQSHCHHIGRYMKPAIIACSFSLDIFASFSATMQTLLSSDLDAFGVRAFELGPERKRYPSHHSTVYSRAGKFTGQCIATFARST